MTFEEFRDSLLHDGPPKGLSLGLTALWWDGKGEWTKAHESAQQVRQVRGCTPTSTARKETLPTPTPPTGTRGPAKLLRENR